MVVVVASAATQMIVPCITKTADIKHVTVLNGTAIPTRIGIRIKGAERAFGISAVITLDAAWAIVVNADAMVSNRSAAPRAVESQVLSVVNAIHVGGDHVGGFIHAVIVDILFVAGNKANCGNKKGNCYQT